MANRCYNLVSFFGSDDALKIVFNHFNQLVEAETEPDKPLTVLPTIGLQQKWIYDIRIDVREQFTLVTYDTQWNPNLQDNYRIANHLNITVMHDFEDFDMSLYGKAIYTPRRILQAAQLSFNDLSKISFDDETLEYIYNDERSQCLGDIADLMLYEKIKLSVPHNP